MVLTHFVPNDDTKSIGSTSSTSNSRLDDQNRTTDLVFVLSIVSFTILLFVLVFFPIRYHCGTNRSLYCFLVVVGDVDDICFRACGLPALLRGEVLGNGLYVLPTFCVTSAFVRAEPFVLYSTGTVHTTSSQQRTG